MRRKGCRYDQGSTSVRSFLDHCDEVTGGGSADSRLDVDGKAEPFRSASGRAAAKRGTESL